MLCTGDFLWCNFEGDYFYTLDDDDDDDDDVAAADEEELEILYIGGYDCALKYSFFLSKITISIHCKINIP